MKQQQTGADDFGKSLSEEDFGAKEFPGLSTKFLKIPAHIFAYLLGHAERQLWEK